jgi:UDPglucose--hexose-1-phosphate uridylyltransferase
MMPELRKDPIVSRWVIVAADRAARPYEFASPPHVRQDTLCPFCEGHEKQTPDEIVARRGPGSPPNGKGWRVRVVPNKFPALEIHGVPGKQGEGLCHWMDGIGVHEVIIESPRHVQSTSELSEAELGEVLEIYRDRLAELKQDPRLVYGMIFKNAGPAAGASLEHLHSQLIAIPVVPINVWEEMTGSLEFFHHHGQCVYCDMVRQELANERRMVLETTRFAAFCPFASRFPFETWILPKRHSSHFENLQKDDLNELSGVLRRVIGTIEGTLDRRAYNYILHTAPFDTQELGHYHWHIEIMPSLTKAAGFEWGTGFYINPVPPEDAASSLRETLVKSSKS